MVINWRLLKTYNKAREGGAGGEGEGGQEGHTSRMGKSWNVLGQTEMGRPQPFVTGQKNPSPKIKMQLFPHYFFMSAI